MIDFMVKMRVTQDLIGLWRLVRERHVEEAYQVCVRENCRKGQWRATFWIHTRGTGDDFCGSKKFWRSHHVYGDIAAAQTLLHFSNTWQTRTRHFWPMLVEGQPWIGTWSSNSVGDKAWERHMSAVTSKHLETYKWKKTSAVSDDWASLLLAHDVLGRKVLMNWPNTHCWSCSSS